MVDEVAESAGDDSSVESSSKISDPSQGSTDSSIKRRKFDSEWRQLSLGLEEVRRLALTGALRRSRLRSLSWAILLEILPPESDKWLETLRLNRKKYSEIKQKLSCDPRSCDHPDDDNPLSQQDESVWNQHFQDAELQTIINLDVVRSFPGVEFFKQNDIQLAMVNVLFCFARETPRLLYRQGMHEILAPLLFVLQSDHKAAEHTTLREELAEIMNPEYLEHDSYALFKTIMAGIETFYRLNDIPTNPSHLPPRPTKVNTQSRKPENEVVRHLALIRDRLLIPQDPELAEHLQNCDIALSLFGIRWLRVLFGREFALHDLLVLWDAIFAVGKDFSLAGYTMVAMLIAIRSLLLNGDSMVCLTHLMHYPTTIDVQYIIDHALYLKHPDQYMKPLSRPFTCPTEIAQSTSIPTKRKLKTKSKPRSAVDNKELVPNIKVASTADDLGIVDGYTLREPEVLREELFHAHSVMTLCNIKLKQYEETIRRSLPSSVPPSHPAHQALGGIRELCTLLKSRYHTAPDVEPALEANEANNCLGATKENKPLVKKVIANSSAGRSEQAKTSKKTNVQQNTTVHLKEVPLKVINLVNSTSQVEGAPNPDPLGLRKD